MQPKALPGFRDFYPADFAFRAHLFNTWRAVAARYGFEEWDGPPLEPLELYTAKSGAEIVGQLYNFVDKGEREVALRPEMTPTLARVVAARANGLRKPIRWYSIPQLFRYERQQRGRLREHFQLNCDLIGEPGPLGDAEIIALAIDIMRAFGLGPQDVRIRLSDRRVLNALLQDLKVPTAQLPLAYQALDKLGRRDYADLRRQVIADGMDAGVLDQLESLKNVRTWEQFQQAKGSHAGAIAAGNQLGQTITALHSMGLEEFLDFDLTIVRGIAYYTGTVFELFDAKRELRAIWALHATDGSVTAEDAVALAARILQESAAFLPQLLARLSQISNLKASENVRTKMIKDYGIGSNYLRSLAEKTGGRIYRADDLAEVPQVFTAITDELGRQYSLGYYPKGEAQPGERRDIKVQTRVPNLVVRARESYIANASTPRQGGQD